MIFVVKKNQEVFTKKLGKDGASSSILYVVEGADFDTGDRVKLTLETKPEGLKVGDKISLDFQIGESVA